MQEDIVKQMGYMALATRLKRISDKMSHSTRLMYKELALDIEPNWYLVLILVRDHPGISVTKIATALGFKHQSVVVMTNKMLQAGYLRTKRDKGDKRKSLLYLTGKARDTLPGLHKIWEVVEQVILELLDQDITIIGLLDGLEQKLDKTSFGRRIIDTISNI